MPVISRVVEKERLSGKQGTKVTVRVTGLNQDVEEGKIRGGIMDKRAQLRALIATGFLSNTDLRERRKEEEQQELKNFEGFDISLDKQSAEHAPRRDIKNALRSAYNFGYGIVHHSSRELDTRETVGAAPVKDKFGIGFVDAVTTAEYTYIISPKM